MTENSEYECLIVTTLKARLGLVKFKLEASHTGELRAEIVELCNIVPVSRPPEASNVNMRRGVKNTSLSSCKSAKSDSPSAAVTASDASTTSSHPSHFYCCRDAARSKPVYISCLHRD